VPSYVRSPYRDTQEIPKGLGTKHSAEGALEIGAELELGLTDIEGFSHLFVIWAFDRSVGCNLVGTPPSDNRRPTTRGPKRRESSDPAREKRKLLLHGRYSIRIPNGFMPPVKTVFGTSPEPQIINEPKSLYQSPAGAHGPVFTQSRKR
jgi:hypothetical protein